VPGSSRLTGWKALAVWAAVPIDIATIIGSFIFIFVATGSADGVLLGGTVVGFTVGTFGIVGALLVTRLPGNPIGWILWSTAITIAGSIFGNSYAQFSVASHGGSLPATVAIAFLSQATLIPLLGAVCIFVPMHFPDGRLPSIWWRKVARFSFVAVAVASILSAVTPGPLSGGSEIPNPLGFAALEGSPEVIGLLVLAALLGPFVLSIASVIARYRSGDPIERQQLRWFGAAAIVMVLFVVLGSSNLGPLAEWGWLLMVTGLALLPIAIGIAVLRYRLYEIDRIISRTIGWAATSGMIVAIFAGIVVGLQGAVTEATGGSTLAVAASTLVAFALFQPLRRRVQRAADRRFDRARYDGERTVAAFADQLRQEVDLGRVSAGLLAAADSTVRPEAASVWLRGGRA
jgi:hypothetical protein